MFTYMIFKNIKWTRNQKRRDFYGFKNRFQILILINSEKLSLNLIFFMILDNINLEILSETVLFPTVY